MLRVECEQCDVERDTYDSLVPEIVVEDHSGCDHVGTATQPDGTLTGRYT